MGSKVNFSLFKNSVDKSNYVTDEEILEAYKNSVKKETVKTEMLDPLNGEIEKDVLENKSKKLAFISIFNDSVIGVGNKRSIKDLDTYTNLLDTVVSTIQASFVFDQEERLNTYATTADIFNLDLSNTTDKYAMLYIVREAIAESVLLYEDKDNAFNACLEDFRYESYQELADEGKYFYTFNDGTKSKVGSISVFDEYMISKINEAVDKV